MRHRMIAHFNANKPPPHFLRHSSSGARAKEAVEDKVAGVGGDLKDAFDQAFGLGG